ncbi:hypothetical protein HN51_045891, partial [Arachis hypogaea]
ISPPSHSAAVFHGVVVVPLRRPQVLCSAPLVRLASPRLAVPCLKSPLLKSSSYYTKNRRNAQLASIPTSNQETELTIDDDFDISGLKPLKVPTQIFFKHSSMDPHKKGSAEAEFFTEYGEAS